MNHTEIPSFEDRLDDFIDNHGLGKALLAIADREQARADEVQHRTGGYKNTTSGDCALLHGILTNVHEIRALAHRVIAQDHFEDDLAERLRNGK